jgi:tripartite-type tricarboxylate transporter receptor subunit TctC
MLAPAATPRVIIDKLNAEALKALASPEVKEKLGALGAEPMPMAPAAFDDFVKSEAARMATVIKAAGIKAQ